MGMGPVIILDPVRDLQLDTYLSSGSIGAFNLQVKVKIAQLRGDPTAKTRNQRTMQVQLNIIAKYACRRLQLESTAVAFDISRCLLDIESVVLIAVFHQIDRASAEFGLFAGG